MPSDFIDDGYTEEFYIAAVPGLHGALAGQRRPMLPREVSRAVHQCQQHEEHPEQVDLLCAAVMADKLVSWDFRDRRGNDVAISPANILRMRASLMNKLWGLVLGTRASDLDPRYESTATNARDCDDESLPGRNADLEGDLGNSRAA